MVVSPLGKADWCSGAATSSSSVNISVDGLEGARPRPRPARQGDKALLFRVSVHLDIGK
jgi:hypothetical protein